MCHSGGVNLSRGRVLTAIIAWLAGAVTASAVGLFALSSIDFGLADHPTSQPLGSPVEASPEASSEPTQPLVESTTPVVKTVERTIFSKGGTVVARCSPSGAYLVSWSPAQGFHAEDVRRGPAGSARVAFESTARKYLITVRCVEGVPRGIVSRDE